MGHWVIAESICPAFEYVKKVLRESLVNIRKVAIDTAHMGKGIQEWIK